MLNAGTGSVENVLNILQRLCSLLSSGLARQFAGGRISGIGCASPDAAR